jgi:phosphoserine phosphatase
MTRFLAESKKIFPLGLAVLALAAAGASQAKRPKNFRRRPAARPVAASTATAPAAEPEPQGPRLMAGRWTKEARAALEGFLASRGRSSKDYDASKPPVAVLSWSDAAVAGDPAELVFLRLTEEARFEFDDQWWELVPVAYGRQPARAAYDGFVRLSSSVWSSQPDYQRFRKTMLSSYLDLCRGVGRKECRQYLARLWAGWRERDARDYAAQALAAEKSRPGFVEEIRADDRDDSPLKVRRGLRLIPEMRDLVSKLREEGVDVWVVDDVPQPVLQASTSDYGVDLTRVFGVQNSTEGARMGGGILRPVPTRSGKADAVKLSLGRPADLVVGRDMADLAMMEYGAGVRIVLSGDAELERAAKGKGWPIQPAFAR